MCKIFSGKEHKKEKYNFGSSLALYLLTYDIRKVTGGIICFVSEHSDMDAMDKKILKIVKKYDISKDIFVVGGDEEQVYRYAVPISHLMQPVKQLMK